jgi:N-acetylglucosaminyldiphosphoundecaprenol N-acetyl-beta-D-mannosaminyltransferase
VDRRDFDSRLWTDAGRRKARARSLARSWAWVAWVDALEAAKRAGDVAGAIGAGAVAAPLWAPLLASALARGRSPVRRESRLGRFGEPFDLLSLELPPGRVGEALGRIGADRVACVWNLLQGDLSLVGPRPALPGELAAGDVRSRRRLDIRPGLLNTFWVRQRGNVDYEPEFDTDREYVETRSLGAAYGGKAADTADRLEVSGVPVDNRTLAESLETIVAALDGAAPRQVCFVNADCVNIAARDPAYKAALGAADLVLADGIGMKLAGRILGRPIRQNVNGTDLFPRLCARLAESGRGVFLLGARPGVAEAVREVLAARHGDGLVRGVRDGYFEPGEDDDVVAQVAASGADVLFVAFGAPRQDLWIRERLPRLGVRVAIGVGGLFDFQSGRVRRAPVWMREVGLEWMYRFAVEPRRMWQRYWVGNTVFLARVLAERVAADGDAGGGAG